AESEQGSDAEHDAGDDGRHVCRQHLRLRDVRMLRQVIDLRLIYQQEEGVERANGGVFVHTVEVGVGDALRMEHTYAVARPLTELVHVAKLDGLRRARFGASGHHSILLPVVTEGTFPCATV